ncbi:MAG: metal-dependent hydrolase [Mariprofundus sp.]|nr:metal-dependent hydrolase [Mariprofundus sp.]
MANFNTHITVAAAGSFVATAICMQAGAVTQGQAAALFSFGTIAGLLPDIDSDHSIPAQWIFRLFSLATALFILFFFQAEMGLWQLLATAAAGAICMRFVILKIFTHLTTHRGLFHSLPAAILAGLAMICIGQKLMHWSLSFTWLAAAFVSSGYLLHLLLDELFSVNLMGSSFKKSFGTALTIFSRESWLSYLLLYIAIAIAIILLPLPPIATPLQS